MPCDISSDPKRVKLPVRHLYYIMRDQINLQLTIVDERILVHLASDTSLLALRSHSVQFVEYQLLGDNSRLLSILKAASIPAVGIRMNFTSCS